MPFVGLRLRVPVAWRSRRIGVREYDIKRLLRALPFLFHLSSRMRFTRESTAVLRKRKHWRKQKRLLPTACQVAVLVVLVWNIRVVELSPAHCRRQMCRIRLESLAGCGAVFLEMLYLATYHATKLATCASDIATTPLPP